MTNLKDILNKKEKELFDKKDSLNTILGSRNQYYLGSYREALIRDWLTDFLHNDDVFSNSDIKVGTGLVTNTEGELSKQIDILLYDGTMGEKFCIKEFCIVDIGQVIGCIEIKSNLNQADLCGKNGALDNVRRIRSMERKDRDINAHRIHYSIFSFSSPKMDNLKTNLKKFHHETFDKCRASYVYEFSQKANASLPTTTRFTPDLILTLEGISLFFGDQATMRGYLPAAFISNKLEREFGVISLFYEQLLDSISTYYNIENNLIPEIRGFTNDELKQGGSIRNIYGFDWDNPVILAKE